MTGRTFRVGGRLLLIDPDDRVLLIHETYELHGTARTHWLTPGGGVEAGEDPRQTAVREALEETGIEVALAPDAPEVLTTRRHWSWRQLHFDQEDHFFAARVPSGLAVRPRGLTDVEQVTLLGHRWWSRAELAGTSETILPPGLADLLGRLLSTGLSC
jgi:8-oxo-dGTP pyrophosphatase MutT (NUDIX family)